jgi:hypothetical protein
LSWVAAAGTRAKSNIGGYIEAGYAGTIDVTLHPDGSCTSIENIRLRWWATK